MLVSSIGHLNTNSNALIRVENNKNQNKQNIVNKGLNADEYQNTQNYRIWSSLKETAGILFNMFSDRTKDMKRSLDMVA